MFFHSIVVIALRVPYMIECGNHEVSDAMVGRHRVVLWCCGRRDPLRAYTCACACT